MQPNDTITYLAPVSLESAFAPMKAHTATVVGLRRHFDTITHVVVRNEYRTFELPISEVTLVAAANAA